MVLLLLVMLPTISALEIELKPKYYIDVLVAEHTRGLKEVYPYDEEIKYDALNFEIIGKNNKLYRILNLTIINTTPEQFKEILPETSQILRILQQKVLWESDPISPQEFEEKNVTFWILVEGIDEKTNKKVTDEAQVTVTMYKEEDTFFYTIGEKIYPSKPLGGIAILIGFVFLIIGVLWFYEVTEKAKQWREEDERKRIERRMGEEGWK